MLGFEPSLYTLLVSFHFEASSLPGCQEQASTLEEEERPVLQCEPPVTMRVSGKKGLPPGLTMESADLTLDSHALELSLN